QTGRGFTHRGGCLDGLAQDLAMRFAFRIAVVEVVLLGARRGDLIEGRVGDVLADLSQGGNLGAAVHLDVADRAVILRRQELRQRIPCFVHVVVTVEDRKSQLRCHLTPPRGGPPRMRKTLTSSAYEENMLLLFCM